MEPNRPKTRANSTVTQELAAPGTHRVACPAIMQKTLTLTQTAIGRKALVAVTGAILFGFVIAHMLGNLQVFLGREHLNAYGAMLHSMPKALWAARIVLLVSVVTHIRLTVALTMQNRAARPTRYRMQADGVAESPLERYARKTMILSGLVLFAFIAFHLAHLTVGANVVPGYAFKEGDVYSNVVHGFRVPWVTGFYVVANVLLGMHLFHGSHSFLQSLGLRGSSSVDRIRNLAIAFAVLVTLGNVSMPLLIVARVVGGAE